jgi:tetratricopeptide (TPR) repeat protein
VHQWADMCGVSIEVDRQLESWLLTVFREQNSIPQVEDWRSLDLSQESARQYVSLAAPLARERIALSKTKRAVNRDSLSEMLNVDESTLYRLQKRARAALAELIAQKFLSGVDWYETLMRVVWGDLYGKTGRPSASKADWHLQQAACYEAMGAPVDMAWQLYFAQAWDELTIRLHRHVYECAVLLTHTVQPDLVLLLRHFELRAPLLEHRSRLCRVLSCYFDAISDSERQREAAELALRFAQQSGSHLHLANAFHDLANWYSERDAERAGALFRKSAEHFLVAPGSHDRDDDYCYMLIDYALFESRKFSGAAIGLLRRADALPLAINSQARANLMVHWGLIEMRIGNAPHAVERYMDAIAIYDALNDQVNMRMAQLNLGVAYLQMRRYEAALRAFDEAASGGDRSVLSNTDLSRIFFSRGSCLRLAGDLDAALVSLERAVSLIRADAEPRLFAGILDAIARVHFRIYRRTNRIESHLAFSNAVTALGELTERHPYAAVLSENLKRDLAGHDEALENIPSDLYKPELAASFRELTEIDRLREQVVADASPEHQLSARLGIARIYLELSIKERQNALALAEQHNLLASTTEAVLAMADRHERTLDSRDRLISRWQERSGLDVSLIQTVLAHFEQHGKLTKKTYVALSGVSAATASRVLARLVEASLILQQGSGASIHYTRAGV